jgi:hypothetical protein
MMSCAHSQLSGSPVVEVLETGSLIEVLGWGRVRWDQHRFGPNSSKPIRLIASKSVELVYDGYSFAE